MLDAGWWSDGRETELVFAVVGVEYPNKATVEAARKALFKHRSYL